MGLRIHLIEPPATEQTQYRRSMLRFALIFAVACSTKQADKKAIGDVDEPVRASETQCEVATECSVVDTSCGCCRFAAISGNALPPWTERHERTCRDVQPCNCQAAARTVDCVEGRCVLQ
jgi:hypothetical protein